MKTQKITIVIDAFTKGGAQKILQIMIEEWLQMSIKVELVLIQNSTNELDTEYLQALGLEVFRLNSANIFSVRKFVQLYRIVKASNPDQVYAHLYWSQLWCGGVNLLNKKAKIVWVEHNTYFDRSRMQWFFYRLVSVRVVKIITVSNEVKKYLENRTSCPTQVIFNPILIHNLKANRNFSKPLFVFVGRFNKQKNPLLAMRAFNYALKNKMIPANSKFNFVGDGPLLKEMEIFIKSNRLMKSVRLLGFLNLSELSQIYSQSMTLVSTSDYEGFSLVRVEAACNGCAVVTTRTSGILGVLTKSEQIKDLISGIFIVENDVAKIANALRESLVKKYWQNKNISERKKILKNHDPKYIANKYLVS